MALDLRDGLILSTGTFPLAMAVAKVGLESGIHPLAVIMSSMLVFSAAAQLLIFQGIAGAMPATLGVLAAIGLAMRLLIYARHIHAALANQPFLAKVIFLLPLTDMSYLEFIRSEASPAAALRRYLTISRCLWMSWQIGTIAAVLITLPHYNFPKEGVSLLIFAALILSMLGSPKPR